MIVKIEGKITRKDPTYIELKTAGISYGIQVSLFVSQSLELGSITELLITQILKEDSNKFYGFLDKKEQFVFNSLLKISGIGATTAMALCSSMDPNSFFTTLHTQDIKSLTAVAGIGIKGAKRILAELGDEKISFELEKDNEFYKARAGLLSLGFKDDKISKALKGLKSDNANELIKQALKNIAK